MGKFRHLLSTFFLSAIIVINCAFAQSNLTQIRDTIYNADGTPFNGTVVITWNGFATGSGTSISPLSTSARIYNGALSVLLVPSTTAAAGSYYQVVYHSSNGMVTWSETWSVPTSTNALSVSGVRTSTTPGSGSGSGAGSGGGSTNVQYATLPIAISQVTGLSSSLNTLSGSVSTLTNNLSAVTSTANTNTNAISGLNTSVNDLTGSLSSLTATVSALSANANNMSIAFIDGETPSGVVDGNNATFVLLQNPTPATSLELYRNGVVQTAGLDYTLSGKTVTFLGDCIPLPTDILQAYYRTAGITPIPVFVDGAMPSGIVNGQNATFTLAIAPGPIASLKLYKNGVLLQYGSDYTISGYVITFALGALPQPGDTLSASYRH